MLSERTKRSNKQTYDERITCEQMANQSHALNHVLVVCLRLEIGGGTVGLLAIGDEGIDHTREVGYHML